MISTAPCPVELPPGFRIRGRGKDALFAQFHYEPHAGQRRIHDCDARYRIVTCGTRWGKTTAAAAEAVVAALEPKKDNKRNVGWVAAPTYDLSDRTFREVSSIVLNYISPFLLSLGYPPATYDKAKRTIRLTTLSGGESLIVQKSTDNEDSLVGEGLDWLIIDESSRIRSTDWTSHLSQRLMDKRGWAMLISTPKGKGWFYDLWKRGRDGRDPEFASFQAPSWENPIMSRAEVEKQRGMIPDHLWRQEYMAEFIEGGGTVFGHVDEAAVVDFEEPVAGDRYFAGLDLAKVNDYTVLTIVRRDPTFCDERGVRVVHVERMHKIDWPLQVARIKGIVERYGNPAVYTDSTAIGGPIISMMRQQQIPVREYAMNQHSKSDLIQNVVLFLERGAVHIPRRSVFPHLCEELEDYEGELSASGNVQYGSPSGGFDDCVVSLALALWPLRRQSNPVFAL